MPGSGSLSSALPVADADPPADPEAAVEVPCEPDPVAAEPLLAEALVCFDPPQEELFVAADFGLELDFVLPALDFALALEQLDVPFDAEGQLVGPLEPLLALEQLEVPFDAVGQLAGPLDDSLDALEHLEVPMDAVGQEAGPLLELPFEPLPFDALLGLLDPRPLLLLDWQAPAFDTCSDAS